MITKSEQISNLAAALLKAQSDIGSALKSSKNPYFKSNYADLSAVIDAIKEPLNRHGITFLQAVDANGDNVPVVDTILLHESGQFLSTRTPVFCAKPNDPQAFGSGVTYSKRYALQALMGLPTTDDDAEAAMARNNAPPKTEQPSFGEPAKRPNMTKTAEEIVGQAFWEFEMEHKDAIGPDEVIDLELFQDAILKLNKGSWPRKKESAPKLAAAIKLADVVKKSQVTGDDTAAKAAEQKAKLMEGTAA